MLEMEMVPEIARDFFGFALPDEAVVDEDAMEAPADGLVQKRRGDRAVHASGDAHDDAAPPNLFPDVLHQTRHQGGDIPVLLRPAGAEDEVPKHRHAFQRVRDFRVEQHAVELPFPVLERGDGAVLGPRENGEFPGQRLDQIPVAHPHLLLAQEPLEEGALPLHREHLPAVFLLRPSLHFSLSIIGKQLEPVADAHDGDVVGKYLRIDAQLPHPAGDKMAGLASEVEYRYHACFLCGYLCIITIIMLACGSRIPAGLYSHFAALVRDFCFAKAVAGSMKRTRALWRCGVPTAFRRHDER